MITILTHITIGNHDNNNNTNNNIHNDVHFKADINNCFPRFLELAAVLRAGEEHRQVQLDDALPRGAAG